MPDSKKIEKIFKSLSAKVARKLAAGSSCHGFDHTERVLANAELIARATPNVNSDVVRFAALLHDVARPEEELSRGRRNHAVLGAAIVREMLTAEGMEEEFVDHVAECVRTHRFRDDDEPVSHEARIVYDADKLDSLGAVGIGRAFQFAGHAGAKLHNRASEALAAKAYGKNDTAYREYLVKLRLLPDAMRTATGRRLALERVEFMHDFFQRLNEECDFAPED